MRRFVKASVIVILLIFAAAIVAGTISVAQNSREQNFGDRLAAVEGETKTVRELQRLHAKEKGHEWVRDQLITIGNDLTELKLRGKQNAAGIQSNRYVLWVIGTSSIGLLFKLFWDLMKMWISRRFKLNDDDTE